MRLQPALALDDALEGFHGPPPKRRRKRRPSRRERLADVRRQLAKQEAENRRLRQQMQAKGRGAPSRRRGREPELEPVSRRLAAAVPDVLDTVLDLVAPDDTYEEDDELEGMGFWRRRKAAARPSAPGATATADGWGPAVRMGKNVRVQAARGYRAAVIDLKPGLYLVAEVPEQAVQPEFGFLPLLAPMMMTAAKGAIDTGVQASQGKGPLGALFKPKGGGRPVRRVRVRRPRAAAPAPAVQPVPVAAPPALPGPVAAVPQLPGPVATAGDEYLVAAPYLGWADDDVVAAAIGCEACDGRCSG